MFASGLEELLRAIGASGLTELAIVTMSGLFAIGVLLGALHRWRAFTTYLPTLLTSVGILGTFAGIIVGLLDFDPEPGQIDGSIAMLLQGLETAFMSSIVGMGLSILFRLFLSLPFVTPRDASSVDETDLVRRLLETAEAQAHSVRDLREAIAGIDESSVVNRLMTAEANFERFLADETKRADIEARARNRQSEALEGLLRALSDADDASLSGQLRSLRQEMAERHRAIRLGMDDASGRLATIAEAVENALAIFRASNSQDVAATLRDVIGAQTTALTTRIEAVETVVGQSGGAVTQALSSQTQIVGDGLRAAHEAVEQNGEKNHAMLVRAEALLRQAQEDRRHGLQHICGELERCVASVDRVADRVGESGEAGIAGDIRDTTAAVASIGAIIDPAMARAEDLGRERNELLQVTHERAATFADEAQERHAEHVRYLEHLSELLSRSATETIIAALKDVIRDFNHHITEQFGDNFRQLNEAVGSLLDWQTQYREQLSEMRRQFDASVQAIADCEASVGSIRQHTEAIPEHMQGMSNMLQTSRHQIEELERHLAAFETLRERAVAALPEVQGIVQATVQELNVAGKQMTTSVETGARSMQQSIEESVRTYVTSAQAANDSARETVQQSVDSAKQVVNGHTQLIDKTFDETSSSLSRWVEEGFKNMDQALRTEIENNLRQMGEQLATVTGTFTRDYEQLVREMRAVLDKRLD